MAVGRDGRLSGPALAAALIRGLVSTGLDVVDLGAGDHADAVLRGRHARRARLHAAASRSPAATTRRTTTASRWCWPAAPSTATTSRACASASRPRTTPRGAGRSATMDIGAEYARAHRRRLPAGAADEDRRRFAATASPAPRAPAILRALGCEVIELYSRGRRRLPQPPPRPEQAREPGRPDQGRARHRGRARPGLRRRRRPPGRGHARTATSSTPTARSCCSRATSCSATRARTIIFDVKCSQRLPVAIREAGGVPLMWKTGHSLIKAKLKETGAPFAGEMSGHLFFGERWYGFDDATYTAARLLEILSRSDDPSAVLDALPTSFSTPELNVPCAEGEHHARGGRAAGARGRRSAGASTAARSAPSTACASTSPTASASSAPATPRRCWCCASRATRPRRCTASRPQFMAALRSGEARRAGRPGRALTAAAALPRRRRSPVTPSLARAAYSTLLRLATPAYLARLWWRGRREPLYRHGLARTAGRLCDGDAGPGRLWLHAVSLGETRAATAADRRAARGSARAAAAADPRHGHRPRGRRGAAARRRRAGLAALRHARRGAALPARAPARASAC